MSKKLAVIALGGNALLRGDQVGTIDEQEQNTTDTLENLVFLLREGYDLVITHGNGPQVGNILMRNDAGEQMYGIAQMPIDICVADSQGGIGYMIERMFKNVLNRHGIDKMWSALSPRWWLTRMTLPSVIRRRGWVRYTPGSRLTSWHKRRAGSSGRRSRLMADSAGWFPHRSRGV